MSQEIERKYLLSALPVGLTSGERILQGYLCTGDPEVRIRAKGERHFVTLKRGEGLVRHEQEAEVSAEVFAILWPATENARIEKRRHHLIGLDGLTWELDEYSGRLTGLFTAEVELPSEEAGFSIPPRLQPVLIRDVTAEKSYKNKVLATLGLPDTGRS